MFEIESWKSHFLIFRICLGVYLCYHFLSLLPFSYEMFGAHQMLSNISLNQTNKIFPNILSLINYSSFLVFIYIESLILFSIFIVINRFVTFSCIYLWYGWAALFNANNLILNPSLAYIGWVLLALAYINYRKDKICENLYWGGWVLLAVGYTISGIAKLRSPSWVDGTAILKVFYNPLARDYFLIDTLKYLPLLLFKILNWFILILEIIFLPLFFIKKTRKYIWHLMIFLHFGILLFINFTDLTLGMLIIHLFTIDWNWYFSKKQISEFNMNLPQTFKKIFNFY